MGGQRKPAKVIDRQEVGETEVDETLTDQVQVHEELTDEEEKRLDEEARAGNAVAKRPESLTREGKDAFNVHVKDLMAGVDTQKETSVQDSLPLEQAAKETSEELANRSTEAITSAGEIESYGDGDLERQMQDIAQGVREVGHFYDWRSKTAQETEAARKARLEDTKAQMDRSKERMAATSF